MWRSPLSLRLRCDDRSGAGTAQLTARPEAAPFKQVRQASQRSARSAPAACPAIAGRLAFCAPQPAHTRLRLRLVGVPPWIAGRARNDSHTHGCHAGLDPASMPRKGSARTSNANLVPRGRRCPAGAICGAAVMIGLGPERACAHQLILTAPCLSVAASGRAASCACRSQVDHHSEVAASAETATP